MASTTFYDTCALLDLGEGAFKKFFYVSDVTLKELENIKTSANKSNEIKFQARQLTRLLEERTGSYRAVLFNKVAFLETRGIREHFDSGLLSIDNNDSKIIACALFTQSQGEEVEFVTKDLACRTIARATGLKTPKSEKQEQEYTGFVIKRWGEDELADFYEGRMTSALLEELLENQYLLIQSPGGENIDLYKKSKQGLVQVKYQKLHSSVFGDCKPKDEFQRMAIDSMMSNQITMLRGKPGSGKSHLALSYLFDKRAKGEIDRVIIFCNTVAVAGAARLGFYPGDKNEKLLDSQIGNFLTSKLGDSLGVEMLMRDQSLMLVPMCDIRGFDTTGMRAGVYITEAQNLDKELMKLALQRIGHDSVCVLDGDEKTQVDLDMYAGANNGMRRASEVFRGESIYGEVELQNIYRSRIAEVADRM